MYSWLIPIVVAVSAGVWNAGSSVTSAIYIASAILSSVTLVFVWSLIADFRAASRSEEASLEAVPVPTHPRQSAR